MYLIDSHSHIYVEIHPIQYITAENKDTTFKLKTTKTIAKAYKYTYAHTYRMFNVCTYIHIRWIYIQVYRCVYVLYLWVWVFGVSIHCIEERTFFDSFVYPQLVAPSNRWFNRFFRFIVTKRNFFLFFTVALPSLIYPTFAYVHLKFIATHFISFSQPATFIHSFAYSYIKTGIFSECVLSVICCSVSPPSCHGTHYLYMFWFLFPLYCYVDIHHVIPLCSGFFYFFVVCCFTADSLHFGVFFFFFLFCD